MEGGGRGEEGEGGSWVERREGGVHVFTRRGAEINLCKQSEEEEEEEEELVMERGKNSQRSSKVRVYNELPLYTYYSLFTLSWLHYSH